MNKHANKNKDAIKELEKTIEYPPEKLYKYMNAKTCCKILESNSIRMTAPSDFNDPYDSKPIFRCCENVIKYDRKAVLEMFKKEREMGALDKNKQKSLLLFLKHNPSATCEVSFKEEIERTRDSVCSDFRVLCLSEEKNNILMWSHYAQNHSGAVIEFDTKYNIFNSCRKVIYSNEAPYISGNFITNYDFNLDINDMKEILSILYTKSDVWQYEKEWRLYFNFETNLNLPELLKDYVDDNALENFKKEVLNIARCIHLPLFNNHITSVYLGCNINPEDEKAIVELCQKNYPKAKIYKAVLDKNYFRINYIEYNEFYKDNRSDIQKLAEFISKMYFEY